MKCFLCGAVVGDGVVLKFCSLPLCPECADHLSGPSLKVSAGPEAKQEIGVITANG
jgi:hypothetical protein